MLTPEDIHEFCRRSESVSLEFKAKQYHFGRKCAEDERAELLKDVLGMANADRNEVGYILIGIKEDENKHGKILGIPTGTAIDGADLWEFVNSRTNCKIPLRVGTVLVDEKLVQVIAVDPCTENRPYFIANGFGRLSNHHVPVRHDARVEMASAGEILEFANKIKPAIDVKLLSVYRVESGCPLLSFDLRFQGVDSKMVPQTKLTLMRDVLRTVIVNLKLSNVSDFAIKDVKCQVDLDADMNVVLSDTMVPKEYERPSKQVQQIIGQENAADTQLRPFEEIKSFASLFVRPDTSGRARCRVTVFNSSRPVVSLHEVAIEVVPIPVRYSRVYELERIWNDAKGAAGILEFLIKTARQSRDIASVDWACVFANYIEAKWMEQYCHGNV